MSLRIPSIEKIKIKIGNKTKTCNNATTCTSDVGFRPSNKARNMSSNSRSVFFCSAGSLEEAVYRDTCRQAREKTERISTVTNTWHRDLVSAGNGTDIHAAIACYCDLEPACALTGLATLLHRALVFLRRCLGQWKGLKNIYDRWNENQLSHWPSE